MVQESACIKTHTSVNGKGLEWYYTNHDHAKSNHRKWTKKNKQYIKEYEKRRREEDPSCRIRLRLSARIRDALNYTGHRKAHKTETLLGCPVEVIKQWLESQFREGMNWKNYGVTGWHIDHVKPCSSFDLSDPVQQLECFNYSNLQPLWWWENITKAGINRKTKILSQLLFHV